MSLEHTARMRKPVAQRSRIALFYSVFAILFSLGFVLTVIGPGHFSIGATALHQKSAKQFAIHGFTSEAVRRITTPEELHTATSTGRCVLFVDCDWNGHMVMFRRPFSDLAEWANSNTDYKTITVKLDSSSLDTASPDPMWGTLHQLWDANSIGFGAMKTLGGAGRVVWFKDGKVVDHAWCFEVQEFDQLKSRTESGLR
jgi:hypothetical protein